LREIKNNKTEWRTMCHNSFVVLKRDLCCVFKVIVNVCYLSSEVQSN